MKKQHEFVMKFQKESPKKALGIRQEA